MVRVSGRARTRLGLALITAVAAALVVPTASAASAVPAPAVTSPTTGATRAIAFPSLKPYTAVVPDTTGDLWFLEANGVGEVHPDGHITEFPAAAGRTSGYVLAIDPSGDIWYPNSDSGGAYLTEVTTSRQTRDFPIPSANDNVLAGPDGTMWTIGYNGGVTRITTAGADDLFATPKLSEHAITSDGTFWFAGTNIAGWITPGQTSTAPNELSLPFDAGSSMIPGANGSVWFADEGNLGQLTAAHTLVDHLMTPYADTSDLLIGPDGNVWFTATGDSGPRVDRIDSAGQIRLVRSGDQWSGHALSEGRGRGRQHLAVGAVIGAGADTPFVLRVACPDIADRCRYSLSAAGRRLRPDAVHGSDGSLWYQTDHLGYGRDKWTAAVGEITPDGALEPLTSTSWVAYGVFFDSAGNAWVLDTPTATAYEVWPTAVSRVSASDRYGTAVAISKREFPGSAPTVFVASGSNYPDALSGGPVAAAAGGPLLLTSPDTLPAVVSAEITRLSPSKIVVIGGPGAVSDTVLAALDAIAPATRIFGSDRYQTSRALVTSAFASAPTVLSGDRIELPRRIGREWGGRIAGPSPSARRRLEAIPRRRDRPAYAAPQRSAHRPRRRHRSDLARRGSSTRLDRASEASRRERPFRHGRGDKRGCVREQSDRRERASCDGPELSRRAGCIRLGRINEVAPVSVDDHVRSRTGAC